MGELMGVEVCDRVGVTGAHMKGVSRLPFEPAGELPELVAMKVLVSAGGRPWLLIRASPLRSFFAVGMSLRLYLRCFGSSGLLRDNSSAWRIPAGAQQSKTFSTWTEGEFKNN